MKGIRFEIVVGSDGVFWLLRSDKVIIAYSRKTYKSIKACRRAIETIKPWLNAAPVIDL